MDDKVAYRLHSHFGGLCQVGDIAPYVLVPGSKARVHQMAELWDDARVVADYHEFLIFSGEFKGVPISACSTGIGGVSVAIAARELIDLGAHTLIRVGVTGALLEDVPVGGAAIASGAIRRDRVSDFYLPLQMPALSSPEVLLALVSACQQRGVDFRVGITATTGSFYCGEGREGFNGYTQSWMGTLVDDFQRSGVMDWDTETATLFAVATAEGIRAGRINGVLESMLSDAFEPKAEERAVRASLDAVAILASWDESPNKRNEPLALPA